ncbi:MAG: TorF family putative porin [Ramlibacter sp.]
MKLKLVALAASLLCSGVAFAQTATTAATPEYTLSFNVGAVTDYRYRGISQTRLRPALQGGADFSHNSGFYLGTWASTIKWIKDAGGDSDVEVDFYGGYKFSASDVGFDVGVLRYQYFGNDLNPSANTTEGYVAGTFGPATLKYSHAFTNLFGFANSKNSYYLDLSAAFDTGYWGLTVTPHVGYQKVKNNGGASYTDWSVTLGKDFGNGLSGTLAYVDTDNNSYRGAGNKNLGRWGVVAGVKYAF